MEYDSLLAIEWFQNSNIKLNQDKYHLPVSRYEHDKVWTQIGDEIVWKSNKEKLLGLQIDRSLKLNEYMSLLCKYANISILARLSNFTGIKQKRVLIKSFTESCPLIWMLHGRGVNNKVNHRFA